MMPIFVGFLYAYYIPLACSFFSHPNPIFDQKAELLGRHLPELYTSVLESITVTASNSTLVGKSVERLVSAIQPNFSHLVRNESNINEFISSVMAKCISKKKHANWQK